MKGWNLTNVLNGLTLYSASDYLNSLNQMTEKTWAIEKGGDNNLYIREFQFLHKEEEWFVILDHDEKMFLTDKEKVFLNKYEEWSPYLEHAKLFFDIHDTDEDLYRFRKKALIVIPITLKYSIPG